MGSGDCVSYMEIGNDFGLSERTDHLEEEGKGRADLASGAEDCNFRHGCRSGTGLVEQQKFVLKKLRLGVDGSGFKI